MESPTTPTWNPATNIPYAAREKLLAFFKKVVEDAPTADEVNMVATDVSQLLGNAPIVGVAINAATFIIQCASQARINVVKKNDVKKAAERVEAELKKLEEMGVDDARLAPLYEVLAASCAVHEATRTRWYDPVVACMCARCDAARLDELASQLSSVLNGISRVLTRVIADRIPHFGNISPCIPDWSRSLVQRRDAVMDLLRQQEHFDRVQVVGIYGMPGLGKTTIMHSVEAEIRCRNTRDAFASVKVGEKPLKLLHELQSDLIFALSEENIIFESTNHGQAGLIKCLANLRQGNKKAYIFVDDVWEISQLQELLPGGLGTHMPPSSYLVITSRFKEVVQELDSLCFSEKKSHVYHAYSPDTLNEQEAKHFFVENAARRGHSFLPDYKELVDRIVPLCCGLPLLLEVTSTYLGHHNSRTEWNDVAKKLKACESLPYRKKVFEILEASINRLKPEAVIEAFMDIALFYSQKVSAIDSDDIQHYLDEENFLQNLIGQSMISVKEGKIRVHDLFREVATNLNDNEKKMVYLGVDEKVASQDLDRVRAAIFRKEWNPAIEKMSQLRYLAIYQLQSFPTIQGSWCELRALRLHFISPQSFPPWISSLKKLRFLQLREVHWENSGEAQLPENLHLLHIESCDLTALPPSLPPNLQTIKLMSCTSLAGLPASLAGSASLVELDLGGATPWQSCRTPSRQRQP